MIFKDWEHLMVLLHGCVQNVSTRSVLLSFCGQYNEFCNNFLWGMNVLCGIYVNIAVRTKWWKLTLSLRNSTPAEKKPNILEKEVLVKYNYWSKYFKLLGLQTGLGSRLISVFHLLKQCCLWNSKKNQRQWM